MTELKVREEGNEGNHKTQIEEEWARIETVMKEVSRSLLRESKKPRTSKLFDEGREQILFLLKVTEE